MKCIIVAVRYCLIYMWCCHWIQRQKRWYNWDGYLWKHKE